MSALQVDLVYSDVPEFYGHHRERVHSDFDTVVFTADSKTSSRNELTAMAGTPGDVWAVGLNGVAAHWDGVNATTEETGVIAVRAVWVTATDVWAFGDRGAIVRRAR